MELSKNKSNLKARIIAAIILAFILFYPVGYAMYFESNNKSIGFEVIDTTSSVDIRSTGKYSNQTVLNHYIQLRYDNGYVKNITTSDPYYYNDYPIGSRHIVNFDNNLFPEEYSEAGIDTPRLYDIGSFMKYMYLCMLMVVSVIGGLFGIGFSVSYIFTGEWPWE